MNPSQLKQIQQLILMPNRQVKKNQFWQALHEDYGVGRLHGQNFIFNRNDLAVLENLYQQSVKGNLTQKIDANTHRLDISQLLKNEKHSIKSVFGEMLAFVGNGNLSVYQNQQIVQVPLGIGGLVVSVRLDMLHLESIKQLIVFENGSMASYFDQWQATLPIGWENALCVYRGHGDNQNIVKALLSKLSMDCDVAFFMDFDLGGLNIIEQYLPYCQHATCHIMLPHDWQTMITHHPDNQLALFFRQSAHVLSNKILSELQKHICENQLAVMQENAIHWHRLVTLKL